MDCSGKEKSLVSCDLKSNKRSLAAKAIWYVVFVINFALTMVINI